MIKITAIWLAAMVSLHAGKLDFKQEEKEINAPADAESVSADFEFTNRSGKDVVISHYQASCSCMTVQLKDAKVKYAPGESGIVRAKFDMGNFSGDVDKVVTLWLDGDSKEGEPSVKLLTKVHIPVLVSLQPKTVTWDVGEKPAAKVIKVVMNGEKPIQVKKVSSGSPAFTCQWKTVEDGKKYEVSITPNNTEKSQIGIFVIETDCDIKKHRVQQCFASVKLPPKLVK